MILAAGDVGVDFNLAVDHLPDSDEKVHTADAYLHVGGVTVNFAVAIQKLGSPVRLLGRVGGDPLGKLAITQLRHHGVDVSLVVEEPGIGTYYSVAIIDRTGEKRLIVVESPTLYPDQEQVSHGLPPGTNWCHTVPYDLATAIRLAKIAHESGIPTSVDLEPASLEDHDFTELIPLLRRCDTVIVNRRAAELLADTHHNAAELVRRAGAGIALITLGEDGVLVYEKGENHRLPGFRTEVVDSTGAGDAFAAAYVHWRLQDASPLEAARHAAAAGALACRAVGGQGSLPTEAEVREFAATSAPS